jgi:hypothetical protein
MSFLTNLLAQLVVGILAHYHARADFRAAVLREVEAKGAHHAIEAMGWKLANPVVVPDNPGALFRVRDDAERLRVRADPPDAADPDRGAHR